MAMNRTVNNVLAPMTTLVLVKPINTLRGPRKAITVLHRAGVNSGVSWNGKFFFNFGWEQSFEAFFRQDYHSHWLKTDIEEEIKARLSFVRKNDKPHKIKRWIKNAAKRAKD